MTISSSYEKLVDEGKVGITGERWSQSTEPYRGQQCERGGCHRLAATYARITDPHPAGLMDGYDLVHQHNFMLCQQDADAIGAAR